VRSGIDSKASKGQSIRLACAMTRLQHREGMTAIKIGEGKSSFVKSHREIVLTFARIVNGKPVGAERDHISSRIGAIF
jgi:hypothetical protein